PPRCTAGPMLNAVLATSGVFVLLAARNPSVHRSLILFAAWSSFAHAAIMLVMSFQVPAQRGELLASVALVGLGGILLMVFAPSRSVRPPGWIRILSTAFPLEGHHATLPGAGGVLQSVMSVYAV